MRRSSSVLRSRKKTIASNRAEQELRGMGDGKIAYIRVMSSAEAQKKFPIVGGLPEAGNIFALHAADGTPLALTDSHDAALGHAMGNKLRVENVH